MSFDPRQTRDDRLPPWEVAKAWALGVVIEQMKKSSGMSTQKLLQMNKRNFIASQVRTAKGEQPSARAITDALNRSRSPDWFPGKPNATGGGRPPVYTEHRKEKIAQVAMDLKRKRIAPTPRRVRQQLPGLTRNPVSGEPMDDKTIHAIYATRCYDEREDDPWQYLDSVEQDALPEELKPKRVDCGQWILDNIPEADLMEHIAIDPCYKLLPKKQEKMEELQVAAMGKKKWISKGSARKGVNLRASRTAKTQAGSQVTKADWTPVFAKGRLRIYVCDPALAAVDDRYPSKLSDSKNLAKFIKQVLPKILREMKQTYKWNTIPTKVLHDKASYMVTHAHERLNGTFAKALKDAGFVSWVGHELSSSTEWLVKKWGDVYPHETVNSHIHRLLDTDFACRRLYESRGEFAKRVRKVERFMNSSKFAAKKGRGLMGLAQDLRARCQLVVDLGGERIPK